MRSIALTVLILNALVPAALGAWTFNEISYSPGYTVLDSGISWRPQGDYALLACYHSGTDILVRYDHPAGTLSSQSYAGTTLYRINWAPDGSYALVTGGTHIYRYDHSAAGFGALTEITDIQGSGTYTTTFFDAVWDPTAPAAPPYISANRKLTSSASYQVVVYRYDPLASPQIYWDYSGGTTYVQSFDYSPVSVDFQADGDYLVIADRSTQGFFVFDPDQSTYEKESSGAMKLFERSGYVGNANAVAMCPIPGKRFVLLKGNGEVQRATQTGVPPNCSVSWDAPGTLDTPNYQGDLNYSGDGNRAVVVDSQTWTPHRIEVFDQDGDSAGIVDTGQNRTIRLYAVAWHPYEPRGLMAGQDGWILTFETDELPTPQPSATPTMTPTPLPRPVPAMSPWGLMLMMLALGGCLGRWRYSRKVRSSR